MGCTWQHCPCWIWEARTHRGLSGMLCLSFPACKVAFAEGKDGRMSCFPHGADLRVLPILDMTERAA